MNINVKRSAGFSRCKQYRYWLTRSFDRGSGNCVFIGLNPSTGNANQDDPTIRRCMGFALDWGYSQLTVVNLYAYRTPYPKVLQSIEHPDGRGNFRALNKACNGADCIVAAWGAHKYAATQASRLEKLWARHVLYCFGETANRQPLHPLYQSKCAALKPYAPVKRLSGSLPKTL